MHVTIVGGGPAGLTTAIALLHVAETARSSAAVTVTVLEKEAYPREKICAGAIGLRGDRALAELGVRINVPSATVCGMSLATRFGERAHRQTQPIGRVIRRIEFDAALAEEAKRRGVRIETGARVTLAAGGDLVDAKTGTKLRGIVVGADGVGSVVRRSLGLSAGERGLRAQVLEVDTPMVPRDRDRTFVHFDLAARDLPGYFWDFPTVVDGAELMSRGVYILGGGRDPGELEMRLEARLESLGLDLTSCKKKRFAERGFHARDRVTSGQRLLVGEAAGIDPSTGEGIAPAIEMGALAGAFLARVAAGNAAMSAWTHVLSRSRVGLDLRLRARAARALYGPSRMAIEELLATPAMMRIGCRMFAGELPAPLDVPGLACGIARGWVRSRARSFFSRPSREHDRDRRQIA